MLVQSVSSLKPFVLRIFMQIVGQFSAIYAQKGQSSTFVSQQFAVHAYIPYVVGVGVGAGLCVGGGGVGNASGIGGMLRNAT